jgi:hypothetical protein
MLILNGYEGTKIRIDLFEGELDQVFALLSDAAREDGITLVIDSRIRGKISLNMDEPWNFILIEILAGVTTVSLVLEDAILISMAENHRAGLRC